MRYLNAAISRYTCGTGSRRHHGCGRAVLTLITGAAAQGGFKGIGERFNRQGLLSFATENGENDGTVRFARLDTGAAVGVFFDAHKVPADISQRERMQAVIQNRETPEQRLEFAKHWQARVKRILLEHADDSSLLHVISDV